MIHLVGDKDERMSCTGCRWIGAETEITIPGFCPKCQKAGNFNLLHCDMRFTQKELKILWTLFGDVPINDQDEIEEDFLDFTKGTDRFDVWHWFDARTHGGVNALLGLTTF